MGGLRSTGSLLTHHLQSQEVGPADGVPEERRVPVGFPLLKVLLDVDHKPAAVRGEGEGPVDVDGETDARKLLRQRQEAEEVTAAVETISSLL